MAEHDDELRELFSAFDEVTAGDELRASTLDYVLAHGEKSVAEQVADESLGQGATLAEARGTDRPRRPTRVGARRVRVAVLLACVLMVVGGAASWLVPVSRVSVTQDALAVELGVNVYGVTVSATAADDESAAVLDEVDVRNQGLDEARENVLDAYERLQVDRQEDVRAVEQSAEPQDVSAPAEPVARPGEGLGEEPPAAMGAEVPQEEAGGAADDAPMEPALPAQSAEPVEPAQTPEPQGSPAQPPQSDKAPPA